MYETTHSQYHTTHSHVWHLEDSFTCVVRLPHMCDMGHMRHVIGHDVHSNWTKCIGIFVCVKRDLSIWKETMLSVDSSCSSPLLCWCKHMSCDTWKKPHRIQVGRFVGKSPDVRYGVVSVSRIDKNIRLFCKKSPVKETIFCKKDQ